MPSTHSSSISYFGCYLSLNSLIGKPYQVNYRGALWISDKVVQGSILKEVYRTASGLIFISLAGLVCWSRVKLGHHTPLQVIAGATIGSTIGWIWFSFWSGYRLPILISGSWDQPQWITSEGYGYRIESHFDEYMSLLSEAWKMRDGGLVWDGLARPALNSVASQLGYVNWIPNGLQASDPTV